MLQNGHATPLCSICCETLGRYGGPVTLPCGHNGCLQCMAHVQRAREAPECPLCRAPFQAGQRLTVNHELRDLVQLASTLHTVEQDGWQTVAAVKGPPSCAGCEAGGCGSEGEQAVALMPSAPRLHVDLGTVLEGDADLLSLEPPTWQPDSHAPTCNACRAPFRALTRLRHHCRLCGRLFCHACCGGRLLLPPKFQEAEPQRVCTPCAALLTPLQPFLAGTISRAVQPAVHDVTDYSSVRSWLNNPLGASLGAEVYKAVNIARSFDAVGCLHPERRIPAAVLAGAQGFAILSVAKVGLGYSCGVGTGLVVVRRGGGAWSPPSALSCTSIGWGLQVGGELTDLLIVLRNAAAVNAFCGNVQCSMGGGASMAVGPLGRAAEASVKLAPSGVALCYSYSLSRGAFAGVSVEGALLRVRDHINLAFYGRPWTAKQLLTSDAVTPPLAASALYEALDDLTARVRTTPDNSITSPGYQSSRMELDAPAGSSRSAAAAIRALPPPASAPPVDYDEAGPTALYGRDFEVSGARRWDDEDEEGFADGMAAFFNED